MTIKIIICIVIFISLVLIGLTLYQIHLFTQPTVTVMSWNIWGGGYQKNVSISQISKAVRLVGADIIGVQETKQESPVYPIGDSVAGVIAEELGYYYFDQRPENDTMCFELLWANAVLSRWPIVDVTPNNLGVEISGPLGEMFYAFNVHFIDERYQPYQLLGWEEPHISSEREAIEYADKAREWASKVLIAEIEDVLDKKPDAVFIFGDFNEPSFLDWTKETVKAGLQPLVVEYPTEKRLVTELGMRDLFREYYPDPVKKPGFTWTSLEHKEDDHLDRIDFTLGMGQFTVAEAGIIGESSKVADVVVDPFPSDHRATYAKLKFKKPTKSH